MALYPAAIQRPITRFRTPMVPARINLHTAVTSAQSLYGFFNKPGQVCSHFYVREDGTVEQYVDTKYRAAADLQGNPDTISIETWDGYPHGWKNGSDVPEWTPAQVAALVKLTQWILATHGTIPAQLAADSKRGKTSHGISYHRLGVDPWRVSGGLKYSNARGKVCPGERRIRQIPGILALATSSSDGGGWSAPKPHTPKAEPDPKPATKAWPDVALIVDGDFGNVTKTAYQRLLAGIDHYKGRIDGDFGPMSVKAEQTWLKTLGRYTGWIDGDRGPLTIKALQDFLYDKRHYRNGAYSKSVMVDGKNGPRTVQGLQKYLNEQRKHYA